jgi:galactitol-specific phosphotransferase system IIC component
MEYYVADPTPSIWANSQEYNKTQQKYGNLSNNSALDPGNLINPLGIVASVGFYLSLITDTLQGGFLRMALTYFVTATWAGPITAIFNILTLVVGIRVLSGRLRWN